MNDTLKVQIAPAVVVDSDKAYYRFDARVMPLGSVYRVALGGSEWYVMRDEHGRLEFRKVEPDDRG